MALGCAAGVVVVIGYVAARLAPPPEPSTSGGPYLFRHTQPGDAGAPVTFDPCQHIQVVINPRGQPELIGLAVTQAVERVARLTGLDMAVVGETDEPVAYSRPLEDPLRYGDGWNPVLIAWSDEGEFAGLADAFGTASSPVVQVSSNGRISHRYVTGEVVLDRPSFEEFLEHDDGEARAQAVVMHELGHLVGLDHVASEHELMYPVFLGMTELGSGDLAGLRAVGGDC